MIAVIYTGFDRFRDVVQSTHDRLFDSLKTIDEIKIYNFTKPNKNRPFCKYDEHNARGGIQLFDLMWALDSIEEQFFIKIRTDIWLTDDAIKAIVDEVHKVKIGEQDISLVGWHFHSWDFDQPYGKMSTAEAGKHTQDFIVIAKKETMDTKENIFEKLDIREKSGISGLYTGNNVIRYIIKDFNNTYTVKTHMYLIREGITTNSSIDEIVAAYMASYGGKGKAHPYRDWYKAKRGIK
jgi:hypothetical protein